MARRPYLQSLKPSILIFFILCPLAYYSLVNLVTASTGDSHQYLTLLSRSNIELDSSWIFLQKLYDTTGPKFLFFQALLFSFIIYRLVSRLPFPFISLSFFSLVTIIPLNELQLVYSTLLSSFRALPPLALTILAWGHFCDNSVDPNTFKCYKKHHICYIILAFVSINIISLHFSVIYLQLCLAISSYLLSSRIQAVLQLKNIYKLLYLKLPRLLLNLILLILLAYPLFVAFLHVAPQSSLPDLIGARFEHYRLESQINLFKALNNSLLLFLIAFAGLFFFPTSYLISTFPLFIYAVGAVLVAPLIPAVSYRVASTFYPVFFCEVVSLALFLSVSNSRKTI